MKILKLISNINNKHINNQIISNIILNFYFIIKRYNLQLKK